MKNLAIVCCLHGNEKIGLGVARCFKNIDSYVGNRRALKLNKRYIIKDMNRIFPGNKHGCYEEKRAHFLNKKLKKYKCVIDLHTTSSPSEPFVILTNSSKKHLDLAKSTGVRNIVIMHKSLASGKALIDNCRCGISIELGLHDSKKALNNGINIIKNILSPQKNHSNRFFIVKNILYNPHKIIKNIPIKNFKLVKKGDAICEYKNLKILAKRNFYPIFTNSKAYENILCFVGEKIYFKKKS